jgi:flagellar hook-associated protein 1 FlgK
MGTINSALSIMSQALDADQAALNVVANNVANANTPGYTRRRPTGKRISRSVLAESRTGRG